VQRRTDILRVVLKKGLLAAPLAIAVFLGGCATRPTAEIREIRVSDLTPSRIKLETVVEVKNPYRMPLPLVDYKQTVDADGRRVFTQQIASPGIVQQQSTSTVRGSAVLEFATLIQVVGQRFSRGSEVPYITKLNLSWKSPWEEVYEFPQLSKSGEIPFPKLPSIWLRAVPSINIDWGSRDNIFTPNVNESRQGRVFGTVFLSVKNVNDFAIRLKSFNATLKARNPTGSGWITLGSVGTTMSKPIGTGNMRDVDVSYSGGLPDLAQSAILAIQAFTEPEKFRFSGGIRFEVADVPVEFDF
jgi:LEA14-like dessication related protein